MIVSNSGTDKSAKPLKPAAEVLDGVMQLIRDGVRPVRFRLPEPFSMMDFAPSRFVLLGGPPGAGKTAAMLQMMTDLACTLTDLRILIANVEMSPERLTERILSRLSGISYRAIVDRELTIGHRDILERVYPYVRQALIRIRFVDPPYTLEHVLEEAEAFRANVVSLDYIQRIPIGCSTKNDAREKLDEVASTIRRICDNGALVFGLSAAARQKNSRGSSYEGLSLASFRGSSELEYSADTAAVLDPSDEQGNQASREVTLKILKNRDGEIGNYPLRFIGALQRFDPAIRERTVTIQPVPGSPANHPESEAQQ